MTTQELYEKITKDFQPPIAENGEFNTGFSKLDSGDIQYRSQSSHAGARGYFRMQIVWDSKTGNRIAEYKGYD